MLAAEHDRIGAGTTADVGEVPAALEVKDPGDALPLGATTAVHGEDEGTELIGRAIARALVARGGIGAHRPFEPAPRVPHVGAVGDVGRDAVLACCDEVSRRLACVDVGCAALGEQIHADERVEQQLERTHLCPKTPRQLRRRARSAGERIEHAHEDAGLQHARLPERCHPEDPVRPSALLHAL
jgi:hypothetical protein